MQRPEDGPRGAPVARVFGHAVHSIVTGHRGESVDTVAYDAVTASQHELRRQVQAAAGAATRWIERNTRGVRASEEALSASVDVAGVRILVSAAIDLVLEAGDNTVHIADLKTGLVRGAVEHWPQMSVCAWLAEQAGWKLGDAILMLVPRGGHRPLSLEQTIQIARRPAAALARECDNIVRVVAAAAHRPGAHPGFHCRNCSLTGCIYHDAQEGK